MTRQNAADIQRTLGRLPNLTSDAPVVILSADPEFDAMRAAIGYGAKGYIPMTMRFEIAMEALHIVLAGGTYVPAECILAAASSSGKPSSSLAAPGAYIPVQYIVEVHNSAPSVSQRTIGAAGITQREMTVLRAIQLGKANKVIAKELDLSVSTVKVHVRHVMSKLQARNRAELAVRAAGMYWADAPEPDSEANRPSRKGPRTGAIPRVGAEGLFRDSLAIVREQSPRCCPFKLPFKLDSPANYTTGFIEMIESGHVRGAPAAASAEERASLMIEGLEVEHIPEPVELPTWDDCADRLAAIYRNVLDARTKRPIDADLVQAAG